LAVVSPLNKGRNLDNFSPSVLLLPLLLLRLVLRLLLLLRLLPPPPRDLIE
jgi:hypothetical protein